MPPILLELGQDNDPDLDPGKDALKYSELKSLCQSGKELFEDKLNNPAPGDDKEHLKSMLEAYQRVNALLHSSQSGDHLDTLRIDAGRTLYSQIEQGSPQLDPDNFRDELEKQIDTLNDSIRKTAALIDDCSPDDLKSRLDPIVEQFEGAVSDLSDLEQSAGYAVEPVRPASLTALDLEVHSAAQSLSKLNEEMLASMAGSTDDLAGRDDLHRGIEQAEDHLRRLTNLMEMRKQLMRNLVASNAQRAIEGLDKELSQLDAQPQLAAERARAEDGLKQIRSLSRDTGGLPRLKLREPDALAKRVASTNAGLKKLEQANKNRKAVKFGISSAITNLSPQLALLKTSISMALTILDDVVTAHAKLDLVRSQIESIRSASELIRKDIAKLVSFMDSSLNLVEDRDLTAMADPAYQSAIEEIEVMAPLIHDLAAEADSILSMSNLLISMSSEYQRQGTVHAKAVAEETKLIRVTDLPALRSTLTDMKRIHKRLLALEQDPQ
jgi:hypothetical protein